MDPWTLVRTGLLPAAVAFAGGLGAVRGGVNSRRAAALLFAAGVWAGFSAEFGAPLPVFETFQWPVLALAGAALLAALWPPDSLCRGTLPAGVSGLLAAAVGWYLLDGLVPRFLDAEARTTQVLVGGALAASAAVGATVAALRVPAGRLGVAWGLWPAATAAVFVTTGSAKGAQLMGMAASALGGLVLWAWLQPSRDWLSRTAAPLVVLLGLAALQQLGYGSEVPALPMALLLVPGLLLGLWSLLRPASLPAPVEAVVLVVLATAPTALGFLLATQGAAEGSAGGYEPYG